MPYRLISQQMLLEHEVLAHLSDALRTALGHSGDNFHKLSSLRFLTESFQRHLERMLELEEHDGYMDLAERSYPQFQPQVASCRREHDEFRGATTRLLAQMQEAEHAGEAEVEPVCNDLATLLDQIDRHNKQEMDLLQAVILQHGAGS